MEGPSLVILKEELKPFVGKKVLHVSGNTKQPKDELLGLTLNAVHIWGKVLFLEFSKGKKSLWTRTHFMMFGSYRIDDPKPNRDPRLTLEFSNGTFYTYACAFRFVEKAGFTDLDRRVDVLSRQWDEAHVLKLIGKKQDAHLCDIFLDQNLFAGSGNIVKNEVLFNIRCHPLTKLSQVRRKDWPLLIHEIRTYCENFYKWKKKYELRRHWQVYKKHKCPLCEKKITREKLGKLERSTFYCVTHQTIPTRSKKIVVHDVLPPAAAKGKKQKEKRLDH